MICGKLILSTTLITHQKVTINSDGIKATKACATIGGTPSGIFITNFLRTKKRYNSAVTIAIISAANTPLGPKKSVGTPAKVPGSLPSIKVFTV